MGSPIIPSYLTFSGLESSVKVTPILVDRRSVWYTYIYLPAVYYPFHLNVTKGSLVAGGVFRCPSGLSGFDLFLHAENRSFGIIFLVS